MNQTQRNQEQQNLELESENEDSLQDWVIEIDEVIVREECRQGLHSAEFCCLYLPS